MTPDTGAPCEEGSCLLFTKCEMKDGVEGPQRRDGLCPHGKPLSDDLRECEACPIPEANRHRIHFVDSSAADLVEN